MRILLVEDDAELRAQLESSLNHQQYATETAADGEEALDRLFESSFDLILLDIMMPKVDGLTLLKEMRSADIRTPVLMLTARGTLGDKVAGLDSGADDYLTKPFAMSELMARIRSLLRRSSGQSDTRISAGGVLLDTVQQTVTFGCETLKLTPKEFYIFEFLLHNKNRIVSRVHLAEHIWGNAYDPFTMSNFIDVHIKNLRQKISSAGGPDIIETVRGIGFTIKDVPF
jgi:DNA-binding response OmpR family regulator